MVNSQWDSTKQPKPVPNNETPVWDYILNDDWSDDGLLELFEKRKEFGFRKYGTYLQPFNGRNAKEDLVQELLDALVYAKQLELENQDKEGEIEFSYLYFQIGRILEENFDLLSK
jgi:hypothetical protein